MKVVQVISIVFIIILILNLILFGLGKINNLAFWIILALCGISSYFIVKMNK